MPSPDADVVAGLAPVVVVPGGVVATGRGKNTKGDLLYGQPEEKIKQWDLFSYQDGASSSLGESGQLCTHRALLGI